jgi:Class II flagellar assembly regulator
MRIYGTNGTAVANAPTGARRAAGGGFSVGEQASAPQSSAAGSLRAVSTLDALLALQGVEDFTQRQKRAVAKGRNALDALDSLKAGLLDGSLDSSTLARLKVAAEGLTEETGDPRLDALMRDIDLRLAVELAKARAS